MIINFLYCIDFPEKSKREEPADKIEGWLFCSHRIINIHVPEVFKSNYSLKYGLPRRDVAEHFRGFPGNDESGYIITAIGEPINLKKEIILEVEVDLFRGKTKKLTIALDICATSIQEIAFDDEQTKNDTRADETEKKFLKTLERHPWITVRMDITNKCNLRCIMCHYKEKEIYSRPAKNITADQLKHYLKDFAPFVKHIMLSCGFEPLMSKHFAGIVSMLHSNFPHMEIGLCTNGMLLDSKARKVIIENNITHVILSLDGATKQTLERIRVGADYGRIIGNIMALRDLRTKYKRSFPVMFMDFVLMNSNIHEAPAFVQLCAALGIDTIDFRHLVGNIFFSEHEEMLQNNKEKYNHFRQLIIAEGKKYNIDVRLPESFDTTEIWTTEALPEVDLADFNSVQPDIQTEIIVDHGEKIRYNGTDADYAFLSNASCLRPFNEIMIVDQEKILPCSYYGESMGKLDENNDLYSIFFNEKYWKVRQKKLQSAFDHHCLTCPIKMNLLPTEKVK